MKKKKSKSNHQTSSYLVYFAVLLVSVGGVFVFYLVSTQDSESAMPPAPTSTPPHLIMYPETPTPSSPTASTSATPRPVIASLCGSEENLLINCGFEDGFDNSGVAIGWQTWASDDADVPIFQEVPDYIAATSAGDYGLVQQIRSGDNAQALYSFFATHDAGIYQQVRGIASGTELRFSVYAHIFSNNLAGVSKSENPGGVIMRVGIDPNGGSDPLSSDVHYTEAFITYDTFVQYNAIAVAQGDIVTVFIRSTVTEPVQNTIVFLDDAVLNVVP